MRRARQRAAYAQGKAAQALAAAAEATPPLDSAPPVEPTAHPLDPHAPAAQPDHPLWQQQREITADLPPFDTPPTREQVAACIAAAQSALARLDPDTRPALVTDRNGWPTPTRAGLEAETAVLHAGHALDARATHLAPSGKVAAARAKITFRDGTPSQIADLGLHEHPDAYQGWVDQRVLDLAREIEDHAVESDPEFRRATALRDRENRNELRALIVEQARLVTGDSQWDLAEAKVRADAYRQALSEQRDFGRGTLAHAHPESAPTAVRRVTSALKSYPTDWVPGPDDPGKPLYLANARGRAYAGAAVLRRRQARGGPWEETPVHIVAPANGKEGMAAAGVCDALHEYGHYQGAVRPGLADVEGVFVARRTTDDDTGLRERLEPISASARRNNAPPPLTPEEFAERNAKRTGREEWARSDQFMEVYAGREYHERGAHETFTTGMEALFAGRYGGLAGRGNRRDDPEHRAFVLGSLGTL